MGKSSKLEQGLNVPFLQLGTDDAQTAGVVGRAAADLDLAGHHVKVQPAAVGAGDDTLGTEDSAIGAGVQRFQSGLDLCFRELLGVNTSSASWP